MRQLVRMSVRPWLLGIWILLLVLWTTREADRILFEKDEVEFYAETSAAFCAVTVHLVIEAWLAACRRVLSKQQSVIDAVPTVVQVDVETENKGN